MLCLLITLWLKEATYTMRFFTSDYHTRTWQPENVKIRKYNLDGGGATARTLKKKKLPSAHTSVADILASKNALTLAASHMQQESNTDWQAELFYIILTFLATLLPPLSPSETTLNKLWANAPLVRTWRLVPCHLCTHLNIFREHNLFCVKHDAAFGTS